ncbi:MAG: HAD family hydrolase [Treponema sp.]|nr:HAD family hydrolase [Treponema sp.]
MNDAVSIENIRGIIFDFDGTLYDSKNIALRLIAARPFDILLIRAERQARKNFEGRDYGSPEAYYREYFAEMSRITRCSAAFLRSWYFEKYMPLMIRVLKRFYPCRPGAAELFRSLAKGKNFLGKKIPFALYSDYPKTPERLRAVGLDLEGGLCYGPEEFGAQKPAPRPFLAIAAALGCAPADVLVIGDRDATDGAGAAAAGMRYINISGDAAWGEFCAVIGP